MLEAATRVSREHGELKLQAPAVCEAETFVKVSTVFSAARSQPPEVINTEKVNGR
jgi:hypothetical protein